MKKIIFIVLILFLSQNVFSQIAIDSLDNYFKEIMELYGSPGASIAVVDNNKIIYNKGFGTRTIGKNEAVNENTLFAIGSITKSFTPIALAILVDEGKLNWDDKVIKYIPTFQLYDRYVTNSFTIRDLLTHRSGLKSVSGGTLFYHSDLTRDEVISGMKHLKAETGFRTKEAYQNIMFVVAAKVIGVISGDSWEKFIRQQIFTPLKMTNTVILESERNASKNISTPHIKNEKFKIIPIKQEKLDNIAPAGSFYSSSSDMAKYMIFVLNKGVVGNDTIVKPRTFSEILKPQFHFKSFNQIHNEFTSYGFGWWLTPKNEHKIIDHSGGVDGASANLIMIENKKFGVIVMNNTSNWLTFRATFDIIGNKIQDKDYLQVGKFLKENAGRNDRLAKITQKKFLDSQIKNTKYSLPLNSYTGTYVDKMYGKVFVQIKDNKLTMKFEHTSLFSGLLSHWHYDTFKLGKRDPRIKDALITFEFDSKAKITGFKIDQPSLLDVDFTEVKFEKLD
jgi:CubicO group peptidase (beta-lactamase class C family)